MMPGGLVRHAADDGRVTVSMQHGGESKDAWVVRDPKSGARATPHIVSSKTIRRSRIDLPSRTADNLYWLGRYVERAEALARLQRTICNLLTEEVGDSSQKAIIPFIEQISQPDDDLDELIEPESEALNIAAIEQILIKSLFDPENPESLICNLRFIERAAYKVKERLSLDTWKRMQALRDVAHSRHKSATSIFDDEVFIFLDETLENLAIFVGNIFENMTRSQGWKFLQIGRRVERALSISALLQTGFSERKPYEETLVSQLLNWADSIITYRRRYLNTIQISSALDLLCFDPHNPRSLVFQVSNLRELLSNLPHGDDNQRNTIDTLALQLFSRIGLSDPDSLLQGSIEERKESVEAFFNSIYQTLLDLAEAVQHHYFAHTKQASAPKANAIIG
ncbi:MAG: circularly permuted type 2 ATP-grasp protein [Verrucomicrobiota bacterium]